MKRARRRSSFTLLELLISISLVAVILTVLMGVYSQLSYFHLELDHTRAATFEKRQLQNRLYYVFSRAIPNFKATQDDFFFFTIGTPPHQNGLIWTIDNGIDLDPLFSNHVLVRLQLEKTSSGAGNLVLNLWPMPRCFPDSLPPVKREVLLTGVNELNFGFYLPPDPLKFISSVSSEDQLNLPRNIWYSEWLSEYKLLPAIVKVILVMDESAARKYGRKKIEFAFPIASGGHPILINQ